MYELISNPNKISSGKIWDQYKLNVSNQYFSGEMVYLFTFEPYEHHTEDYVLSVGVQENLYHIVNINNHLMDLDQKDLYFRRFNFCYEVSRAMILQKQHMNIFNKLPVGDQPTKQVLISYEDNLVRLDLLVHDMMENRLSMLFTEFLKMYKNMALGVKLLHKKFFHCNITVHNYSVEVLDKEHVDFFEEEFFEPIILSDKRAITVKLESFGDLVGKHGKCRDGNLSSRPHEVNYKSLPSSFKHDVYSLAVAILDIEYMYTLKQKPSELLAILMKYFDGPGSDLKAKFMNPEEQLSDEEFKDKIFKQFQGELSGNLLFNFLIQQLKLPHNIIVRQNVLKFMREEKEISEDQFKLASLDISEMEDLCLKTSIRLTSITLRGLLVEILEHFVSTMRLNKKTLELKNMEPQFYVRRRTGIPTILTDQEKADLTHSLISVKAMDYQRDLMKDFYSIVRQAFHYKWARRIPIIDVVNGIIKIQIELEEKLKATREIVDKYEAHDFMQLNLKDPAEDLE